MDLSRSLAGLAVVVVTGLVLTPAVHGVHQTSSFDAIVATYLSGDAAAAVEVLAAWPAERVEAAVRDSPDDHDEPWFRAGLVMLHTEAGIRKDTFALARPDVGVWHGAIRDYEVHYRRARLLVNDLIDEARARNLPELLDFCRRWFVVASPWSVATTSQDAMPDVWDGHPDVLLLEGRHEEYRMGPEIDGPPVAFSVARRGEFGRGPRIATSHGRFHPIRASDAMNRFRRVLEQEPRRAEARLRLGRVLYLLDRTDEARPELERALADARETDDVFSGYLAALFLGQLHEDADRVAEATDQYETALSIYPDGWTAHLALGRLQLLRGASSDGWAAIRPLLTDTKKQSSARDPWYGYGFRQRDWRQGAQLVELRSIVIERR